jgi:hypothetical protein
VRRAAGALADGVVGDLLVRTAPPQGEGLRELRRPVVVAARRGIASADDEALEAVDVQLLGGDGRRVAAGGPGHRRHRLAQLGDDRVQGVRRRRAVGPQQVVEAVDRHRLSACTARAASTRRIWRPRIGTEAPSSADTARGRAR